MISLKEIVIEKNNVRQQMLDAFGINPSHHSIYNAPITAPHDQNPDGLSFKIPNNVYYFWRDEYNIIQRGKFPGITLRLGSPNRIHFHPNFEINNLNNPIRSGGEITLGDLVSDIISMS